MAKKGKTGADSLKASIASSVKSEPGRQWRDRLTRAVQSPIKGQTTNAKQWNRWTP